MRKCIACGSSLTEVILTLDNMPAKVQNLPIYNLSETPETLALNLMRCPTCQLVQFDCEPVDYYRDVIRARGFSLKMHDLHYAQFANFIRTCNLEGKRVVEVGCGAGEILSIANELPIDVFGIEHSRELVSQARHKGLDVKEGFVDKADYTDQRGPYDAFISINYLEHQPNPCGMLEGIHNILTANGVGLITVPSLDYLLKHSAYYELMRDHIAYYDVSSLSALLSRCGFSILKTSVFNSDTLSVIVEKRSSLGKFGAACAETRLFLLKQIKDFILRCGSGQIAVWGASHQCFTLLSTLGLNSNTISCIVDSASFKWGRMSPGSQIPIVSPDTFVSNDAIQGLLIVAPGFSDEIAEAAKLMRPDLVMIGTVIDGRLHLLKE